MTDCNLKIDIEEIFYGCVLIQIIQLKSDETTQLLNKPNVNEVTLTGQNSPLKYS